MQGPPLTLLSLARDWSAHPLSDGWKTLVRACIAALGADGESTRAAVEAWRQLAMLFGDSGAPELCAVSALYGLERAGDARAEERDDDLGAARDALQSHTSLALLDLGLARSVAPGAYVALARLDMDVRAEPDAVVTWLREFVAPAGGLTAAAGVCVRVAAIRAGLAPRPDPFTLEGVASLAL